MERDLNNDDFELFLKQKADQHKLFPSDKVWRGINNSLHPGLKWIKIGGSVLLVTALALFFQETDFRTASNPAAKSKFHKSSPGSVNSISAEHPAIKTPAGNHLRTIPFATVEGDKIKAAKATTAATGTSNALAVVAAASIGNRNNVGNDLRGFILRNNDVLKQELSINVAIPATKVAVARIPENDADLAAKELTSSVVTAKTEISDEDRTIKEVNWLQEFAAIKLTTPKKSRFNLQFYFSPTISYRRLVDNQHLSHSGRQNIPIASRDLNVNKYVDQNASIGAELGSNVLFSVGRNLTIKSGLQLNYSRYNIKAFRFNYEKASIALNTSGPVADTISSYTSFRNFNGYSAEQLQNQYLQISVPIGAELKVLGNKRLQFNVAGTIQPTFLLFSDTYLLSSNYLNYTKEPSLVRKWNAHSSFEAFLSYKVGGLRWQLGPQFRYQLMSSYNDRYPIKEYLFEYGLKIGVSTTFR